MLAYLPTPGVKKYGDIEIFASKECHFRKCQNTLQKSPEGLPNVPDVSRLEQHLPTMYCAI